MARVLLTGDTVGGVWTFTLELAEGLIARGADVCLATMGKTGTASQRAEASTIRGLTWFDSDFKLEWMEDPWSDVERSSQWLLEIARQFKPEVVHLNTLCHGDLDWDVPVVVTVHSCVASWWSAVKHEALPASWNQYRRAVERSLRYADVVTAPSHAMLASAQEEYGVRDGVVVANGRRPDRFRSAFKEPFILAAGRLWDEGKNVRTLAELAPALPWPVFLAGDPAELPGCHMLGRLSGEELASWYSRASIYALPARYEPFGFSALEAALSRCALVLGAIPSLREVWGDAAVFVPPDDAQSLGSALVELMKNPAERERMAARAADRARRYTQSSMVAGYIRCYELACARANERRFACAS